MQHLYCWFVCNVISISSSSSWNLLVYTFRSAETWSIMWQANQSNWIAQYCNCCQLPNRVTVTILIKCWSIFCYPILSTQLNQHKKKKKTNENLKWNRITKQIRLESIYNISQCVHFSIYCRLRFHFPWQLSSHNHSIYWLCTKPRPREYWPVCQEHTQKKKVKLKLEYIRNGCCCFFRCFQMLQKSIDESEMDEKYDAKKSKRWSLS